MYLLFDVLIFWLLYQIIMYIHTYTYAWHASRKIYAHLYVCVYINES